MPNRSQKLVIVGAGGHAKVVVELFRSQEHPYEIVGLTDLDPQAKGVAGLPVLGADDVLDGLRAEGVEFAFPALGANALRGRTAIALRALGFELPNALSRFSWISPSATLGDGVAVMAGAVVNAEASLGDLVIVNSGAVVEHDCRLGEGVHLGPGSAIAGGVSIGARTLLGVGASVIPGLTIGADVVVAAGACVTCDLPDAVMAAGVPARIIHRLDGR